MTRRTSISRLHLQVGGTVLVAALLLTACATVPVSEEESYLRKIREKISKVWAYPCVQVTECSCEYKSAELEALS